MTNQTKNITKKSQKLNEPPNENVVKDFIKHDYTDKSLKQQLIISIKPIYLKDIQNKCVGFRKKTCLSMIAHIYIDYAYISESGIHRNNQQ